MNHVIKRCLQASILAGGLWVIGQGIASADSVQAPATAPATACGNSIGIFSDPSSGCPASSSGGTSTNSDGSDVNAPANTPVNVTGNSVLIGQPANTNTGSSGSSGSGSTGSPATSSGGTSASDAGNSGGTSNGTGLLGTGLLANAANTAGLQSTSADAPVNAPATVCGNTVGIGSSPSSGCPASAGTASSTSGTGAAGDQPGATGSGTNANAPVSAPATVCGNGIGLFGSGGASCGGVAAATATNPGRTTPSAPALPVSPSRPGVLTLFSDAAQSLASTGSDIESVMAIALGLLFTGVTMALAFGNRTTGTSGWIS